MDQFRNELLYSNIKGKNPFKDKRVREAVYRSIDIDAIRKKVMRGLSNPSALMVGPGVNGFSDGFKRPSHDPAKAKQLLAAAGYPNGFEIGMDCPNDRYVNDEAICQAVVSMLAKVGVTVKLNAQPKAKYFPKVLAPKLDTSFYLLGWTPAASIPGTRCSTCTAARKPAAVGRSGQRAHVIRSLTASSISAVTAIPRSINWQCRSYPRPTMPSATA